MNMNMNVNMNMNGIFGMPSGFEGLGGYAARHYDVSALASATAAYDWSAATGVVGGMTGAFQRTFDTGMIDQSRLSSLFGMATDLGDFSSVITGAVMPNVYTGQILGWGGSGAANASAQSTFDYGRGSATVDLGASASSNYQVGPNGASFANEQNVWSGMTQTQS